MATTVLVLPKIVATRFSALPLPGKERLAGAFDVLISNPKVGEELPGQFKRYRRLQVWPYEVVYLYDGAAKKISVVAF